MAFFHKIGEYMLVGRLGAIARRYFVMNAFDGALTMLGILTGAYLTGRQDVSLIIHAGFGASIAMAMSGMTGAYMTEKAERKKELQELEDAMLTDLNDSVYGRANRFAPLFTALIDGISPALAAVLILSPFILVDKGVVGFQEAFSTSMAVTVATLFLLGAYLARISRESALSYGLQMVAAGLATATIIFLVEYASR